MAHILPLTVANNPLRTLFFDGLRSGGLKENTEPEVIKDLKLLCRDQPATAHDAFRALVNISDSNLLAGPLSDPLFLGFLVSYILNPSSVLSDLACMLLSNITAQPGPCAALLKLEVDIIPLDNDTSKGYYPIQSRCATSPPPGNYPSSKPIKERALSLLVEAFAGSASIKKEDSDRKGQLHFLAGVFANISGQPDGRQFFLTPQRIFSTPQDGVLEAPLAQLLPFTEHPDIIRRGGVASTIKNCAFIQEAHKALLSSDKEVFRLTFADEVPGLNVLPRILLPLAGPEEFELEDVELLLPELQFLPSTKARESDPVLRVTHLETLILLCTSRWGRDIQRQSGVYEIIRMMHETETDDNVITHVERLVNLLKRDEAPETQSASITKADESDDDDKIVEV
ncbi:SubName: Full=Uncharacterized protein {ECO:0000313/EMBL:CCA71655.1} [Serendipita indica DSM 11827]|nr:SubName: Full=Uncharacterized protein {ECO:0000313/EMBL:CCA71655.1} [Serendipita indica DSM 11827]